MFNLRLFLLLALVTGTLEDGFDLSDAIDDDVAPTPKPKEPKAPEKPKLDGGLDLGDALGSDDPLPTKKPSKPNSGDSGGFDLGDAVGPDLPEPKPDKPVMPPKNGGGGGSFDDSDLLDVGAGGYKPDGGRSGGGGASDPNYDPQGGAGGDQPQEAGSGKIAGIASAIGVALLGAASSYFAYQKKKLCFKLQGGQDPESGKGQHGTQSDPQVLSNLLRTS